MDDQPKFGAGSAFGKDAKVLIVERHIFSKNLLGVWSAGLP